ncbi:uncharacterized protein BX664DRAFT_341765 [Halteromyces radiatus]|uniref:uncharacterized protein n=1 Tax=Halteromyces radiatus TaxID=101107 RepID=UPI00221FA3BE|nr:uncharacterized protein BX664DRAFT_341765 [Halteromyces radiatus]KAI8079900.1 hypothetical protein BX664DRAFT_341765 [Halteromyces radiatus]
MIRFNCILLCYFIIAVFIQVQAQTIHDDVVENTYRLPDPVLADNNNNNYKDNILTDFLVDEEDEEDDDSVEEDDEDDELSTTYDIDAEPLLEGGYYGYGQSKEQEQGDELGEELYVEYDDETDNTDNTGLLFEDDEEPLEFKNNEDIDINELLFESSQKDQQQYDHSLVDATHQHMDDLLGNAHEALDTQPNDDDSDDDEHPDHSIDTDDATSLFQDDPLTPEDHTHDIAPPPPPPPSPHHDDFIYTPDTSSQHSRSHYKLPLFGVLLVLVLLYKSKNKNQGGRSKFLEKEENKGLPLHNKDINTPDIVSYPTSAPTGSILLSSPTKQGFPTIINQEQQPTQQQPQQQQQSIHQQQQEQNGFHGYLGRRSSASSTNSGRHHSLSGVAASAVGVHGGHTRRISLGHPIHHAIKESKWEEDWDEKVEKHRQ